MASSADKQGEYPGPIKGHIKHPDRCDVCNAVQGNCACSLKDYEERRVPPKQWEQRPENYPENDPVKPNYYRRTIKGVEIDVIDIIQAWKLGFCLGNVLKYILRAGQKEGNSKEQDLKKAGENIERELTGA